jgi:hypothetical protein
MPEFLREALSGTRCIRPLRPRVVGRAYSRLTVLEARPNPLTIVGNDWPWTSPKLKVSRSSALMCLYDLVDTWQHHSPSGPVVLHLELELKHRIPIRLSFSM